MKRLMIAVLVAGALLAGVTGVLRSHSLSINAGTAAMPTMQELHGTAGVDKLRVEDFEDRSLVFSKETKR